MFFWIFLCAIFFDYTVECKSCNSSINNCGCSPGYSGESCEIFLKDCSENPCINGECVEMAEADESGRSFMCFCKGYEGFYCEKDINECGIPHYCGYDGLCVNTVGNAFCMCRAGYAGDRCQIEFDRCLIKNYCLNDGICIDGGYCSCLDGYSGVRCERIVPRTSAYLEKGCWTVKACAYRFADGYCDLSCNTENCMLDGYDCINIPPNRCVLAEHCTNVRSNGKCNPECYSKECAFDGADCRNHSTHTLIIILRAVPYKLMLELNFILKELKKILGSNVQLSAEIDTYAVTGNSDSDRSSAELMKVQLSIDVQLMDCDNSQRIINSSVSNICFKNMIELYIFLSEQLHKNGEKLANYPVEDMYLKDKKEEKKFSVMENILCLLIFVSFIIILGIYGFMCIRKHKNGKGSCRARTWKIPSILEEPTAKNGNFISKKDEGKMISRSEILLPAMHENNVSNSAQLTRELKAHVNYVDNDGNTALHHAVRKNNAHNVQHLLETGKCDLSISNDLGQTALIMAARSPHISTKCSLSIVQYIKENLKRKYSSIVSEVDVYGRNVLHYAANNNRLDLIEQLLSRKFKVNEQDLKGETALHLAAREGHFDSVRILLESGADPNARDQLNRTAYDFAAKNGHKNVVDILKEKIKTGKMNPMDKTGNLLCNGTMNDQMTNYDETLSPSSSSDFDRFVNCSNSFNYVDDTPMFNDVLWCEPRSPEEIKANSPELNFADNEIDCNLSYYDGPLCELSTFDAFSKRIFAYGFDDFDEKFLDHV